MKHIGLVVLAALICPAVSPLGAAEKKAVEKARAPALEPGPGERKEAVKVTLKSATPGAIIRYTLNGTTPGPDGGRLYTAPISIDKSTTVVAVAFKDGLAPGPATNGIYLIGSSVKPGLSTFHVGNSLTKETYTAGK